MCKRIIKKGNIKKLVVDRSLDYSYEEIEETKKLPFLDILLLSGENLFQLVEDIISARRLNSLSRIVILPSLFQENLISSLFPYAEFIRDERILLSSIYSGEATYTNNLFQRKLTKKEERFLPALSYGLSDKEIALVLGVSRRTVIRNKQQVIEKSGLISTYQLPVFSALKCYLKEKDKMDAGEGELMIELRNERKRESNIRYP